jgi:hypothetical protein
VFQLQRDFHPGEMSEQNRNSALIRTRIVKPEESLDDRNKISEKTENEISAHTNQKEKAIL